MSAERVIASLLRIARQDLDGAVVLARAGNRNAAYLCEQAAEKVIRAVVTSENRHAGVGHHLDEMVDELPDANPLKAILEDLVELAGYATSYRYATPAGRIPASPSPDDLDASIALVDKALTTAAAAFGVDLSNQATPATKTGPVR